MRKNNNNEIVTSDKTIIRAAIHPTIGVARVGNSDSQYFIGPEVPYPTVDPTGGYKDPLNLRPCTVYIFLGQCQCQRNSIWT
jgi:hypothetical protein